MRKSHFKKYILPAHWASALIYADETGMQESEVEEMNSFLESEKPGYCVDCSSESFFTWRNDAGTLGGDCLEFTFQDITQ